MAEKDVLEAIAGVKEVVDKVLGVVTDLSGQVGTLSAKDSIVSICTACNGLGVIYSSVILPDGTVGSDTEEVPCPVCAGTLQVAWGELV